MSELFPDATACRSCGADIRWVTTEAGKRMPVDPERIVIVLDDGKTVSGRRSHFATCPDAEDHRQEKRA